VRPSVQQVMQRVAAVFNVEVVNLKKGRRGEANDARQVAMYLVKRPCNLTLQETARHFGVESYGVVGWACVQIRAKQATDQPFKKWVEQVETLYGSTKDLTVCCNPNETKRLNCLRHRIPL
jgi:chromosomal replication initiation ATPase DnaA